MSKFGMLRNSLNSRRAKEYAMDLPANPQSNYNIHFNKEEILLDTCGVFTKGAKHHGHRVL